MKKYSLYKEVSQMKYPAFLAYPFVSAIANSIYILSRKIVKVPEGLTQKKVLLHSDDGDHIVLRVYIPDRLTRPAPCLLYYYGSAYFLKPGPHHKNWATEYALQTKAIVIVVEHRLAPAHPFPVPLQDCFQASEWVFQHADHLHIDPDKIAVGGDSAGGAIASVVSMMRRDKGLPNFCFQFLIYPVTDARMDTPSMKEFSDTPLWSSRFYQMMWALYIQEPIQTDEKYAAPMEADSFKDLPEAYIEVCEFDPLRDEGLLYGDALMQAGVAVDISLVPNVSHGYDFNPGSTLAEAFRHRRLAALKRAFKE